LVGSSSKIFKKNLLHNIISILKKTPNK